MEDIVEKVLSGDRRAIARLITMVENGHPGVREIMRELYPRTGNAHVIGITGAPGSGKSSLVNKMTAEYRKRGKSVGVIAVDPTSPFTGGALLGDRIRMQSHATDKDVFIRSMGTRGSLGGLSRATSDAVTILDASGKDIIIVETVGAGQSEVDIVNASHTPIVVLVPGMGDEIQAIKAGILEIGSIFVVNKADREGVERVIVDLEMMLDLAGYGEDEWKPPIVTTIAVRNKGIKELVDKIAEHMEYLKTTGDFDKRVRDRVESELKDWIREEGVDIVVNRLKEAGEYDALIEKMVKKEIDPHTAAIDAIKRVREG
ncbi:MAG TPA: methylmalonyl Co-A mutase-associated GTPase MeaB [Candidatus Syntrophoarchaeum butanivorans]|uniref:LAO/AO transporter ATPase n=2 Tax=Candidatus Syntropharchaeum butanivorans TaxID=1839936 RepID=A0A1F2P2Z3_9EURY|nr:MAG: LAO/AO transporter ATPase [Candidatus Syntrophoarchaeum butanivorans]RJS70423.1 MAG: methylmalonyl Co-A mutase-associated GTPase MeaB [Candidatus Syntrophoarchaeum sp. WYZ-LMO15]HEC57174.1 methylmalonyl Co-A mutase-associated GTPase MeaB [Candidatus Syntrophoarchaeum butanivorans]